MTKLELEMTNNELEARVIELEAKLRCAEHDVQVAEQDREEAVRQLRDVEYERDGWELKYEVLADDVAQEAATHPVIAYADWYRAIHPVPGGDPDLAQMEMLSHFKVQA